MYARLYSILLALIVIMISCNEERNENFEGRTKDKAVLLDSEGNLIKPYKDDDTVYYGPSGSAKWIPLSQLPIKSYSFKQILKEFGQNNLIDKEMEESVRSVSTHFLGSMPQMLYDNCMKYINSKYPVYYYTFRYPDGSNDYLELYVVRDNNDIKILWGYRIPSDYIWPE